MKLPIKLTDETETRLERLTQATEEIALALKLIALAVVVSQFVVTMGGQDGG